ncbi:O-antigen ligase family protein [Deinococcus peraridilitoris]|uniref:O-antigen ligase family protein n=1 Tax=Deinococcus peraridilitoris TaxID=432329 RepID=UPI001FE1587F|nr:O-antigen ligase family protein [Deinococcus peraridilitoris]
MSHSVPTHPPRRVAWLLALIPVFPILHIVALAVVGLLRELSLSVRWMLGGFVATQIIAACLTPSPLLSLLLAAARSLLVLSMIAAGIYLRESRRLRPLVWGHLVVFATAWIFTLATAGTSLGPAGRLSHPLYYFVSLGLVATVSLWIIVSWKGASPWWRFPAGALALATLAATGSRGPILALIVGALAAVLAGNLRFLRSFGLVILLGVVALGVIPNLRTNVQIDRVVTDTGLSGRERVWEGALKAFRASPIGGQGPYQIGPYLGFLYSDRCQLNPALENAGVRCPDWLARFRGAWLIAHNVILHSLAETGVVGTLGLLTLLALGAVATWQSRDGLLLAIYWGFMAMNMVDVVTAIPSPHFAELFWVVIGMAFVQAGWTRTPERQATALNEASPPAA